MAFVIGVDVGGTFTDAVLDDDAGTVLAAKSPSTPPDYSRGVLDVLELLAEQLGISLPDMLAGTHHIAHGTTSSLNALVTGNVPPVGFLTTKGHRDSIFIMNVGPVPGPVSPRTTRCCPSGTPWRSPSASTGTARSSSRWT